MRQQVPPSATRKVQAESALYTSYRMMESLLNALTVWCLAGAVWCLAGVACTEMNLLVGNVRHGPTAAWRRW